MHGLWLSGVLLTPLCTHQVGVKDVKDKSNWSCSDGFKILLDDSEMSEDKKDWTPGMTVTSPKEGDMAHAGETYTVLVRGNAR